MGLFSGLLGGFVKGIGGAIAGRIGGSRKTSNHINFQQLRADAEAAGFNPLTALRTTGGALCRFW